MTVAEQTERDIDLTRLQYVPVAVRTQILFFCVSDLSNVDPMYQYSLEWFLSIFMAGISNSEGAGTVLCSEAGFRVWEQVLCCAARRGSGFGSREQGIRRQGQTHCVKIEIS